MPPEMLTEIFWTITIAVLCLLLGIAIGVKIVGKKLARRSMELDAGAAPRAQPSIAMPGPVHKESDLLGRPHQLSPTSETTVHKTELAELLLASDQRISALERQLAAAETARLLAGNSLARAEDRLKQGALPGRTIKISPPMLETVSAPKPPAGKTTAKTPHAKHKAKKHRNKR